MRNSKDIFSASFPCIKAQLLGEKALGELRAPSTAQRGSSGAGGGLVTRAGSDRTQGMASHCQRVGMDGILGGNSSL